MGTEEKEQDYSLRKSFEKVGLLPGARLLVDKEGRIIDGVHSWIAAKQLGLTIPSVTVDVGDPGDTAIFKLVTNKCRRELEPEEITVCLDIIGHHKNWKVKDFLDRLPFSYSWLMKYLPDRYKDAAKAKAGAEGGKATAKAFREAAARRQPKSEEIRYEEPAAPEDEQPAAEEGLKEGVEAVLSVEESCERFERTFLNHLAEFTTSPSHARTIEKDLPIMLNYVNEKHDCNNCPIRSSCDRFVEFYRKKQFLKKAEQLTELHYRILALVPACVKEKITNSPL